MTWHSRSANSSSPATRSVIGLAGFETLAAALLRGVLPKLQSLSLDSNSLGNHGIAALAPVLRKLPELKDLDLVDCDEALASLFADLGTDGFRALARCLTSG